MPRAFNPKAALSLTLIHGKMDSCWNTMALSGRADEASRTTSTVPAVLDSRPATMRSSVVLPHPEGPTMARNSPAAISRLTPANASKVRSFSVKRRCRSRTRTLEPASADCTLLPALPALGGLLRLPVSEADSGDDVVHRHVVHHRGFRLAHCATDHEPVADLASAAVERIRIEGVERRQLFRLAVRERLQHGP